MLDLQSRTVGEAVISMSHWLLKAHRAGKASPLDVARKLIVVNDIGMHSMGQVCLSDLSCLVPITIAGCVSDVT